ncbi:TetR/AcrR family transcriptional regulator [Pontibacter silvestris]|uniref:TetR/AcrR family transcriptional regulator n=1 Tax=Pontibacter silvestris TaxID=2305183 RepID=A0ABW4X1C1_9BACT|nr:TetR/AcrR family transcriptional regulator [Pontibacter silvestris]MCC9135957.1 TetR/AcrR family transcriptional regulator [Pontibacter silvestris]
MKEPVKSRDRIVQQAQQMFFTQGYSKILMTELARQLGMSKKTLYQHFKSKEELLCVVIREYNAEIQEMAAGIMKEEMLSYPEKISKIFTLAGIRMLEISPSFVEDVKRNAPVAWELMQKLKAESAFLRFSVLLDEGVRDGCIRNDINQPLTVLLYACALEKMFDPDFVRQIPEELLQELPDSPAAVFEGITKVLFNGILDKPHTI